MCGRTACTDRGGGGRKPEPVGYGRAELGASRRPYSVADEREPRGETGASEVCLPKRPQATFSRRDAHARRQPSSSRAGASAASTQRVTVPSGLRRRTRPLASASARPRGSCAGLAERPALDLVGLPVELDTERARVASAELLDEPAGRPAPRAPAVSAEVIRAWARDPTGPTVGRACALPGPACPAGGAGSRRRARRGSSAPPSPGRRRAPAAPPARARRRGRPRRSR